MSPVWDKTAFGAEIITTTGDRLTGTIIEADADSIRLKTPYAGIIEIHRAQVRSVQPGAGPTGPVEPACADAAPMTVADGAQPDDQGATGGATGGVTAGASGGAVATPAPAGSSPSSPFAPGSELSGRINFALSHDQGNTDKDEIDFDYQLEYRWGRNRLTSLGALEYDTNAGEKTTDKWSTYNQYTRLFPSRWYGSAWLAFKHDRFADLRLRSLGGPAIGYLAFESKALNLSLEAGPAVLQDDFYDHVDHQSTGSAWSLNYNQLLWQARLRPYHRQFGYIALDGEGKVLWNAWTGLRIPLAGGFIGSIELEYDYDSAPAVNTKTTDTTLRLKLGYQW